MCVLSRAKIEPYPYFNKHPSRNATRYVFHRRFKTGLDFDSSLPHSFDVGQNMKKYIISYYAKPQEEIQEIQERERRLFSRTTTTMQ